MPQAEIFAEAAKCYKELPPEGVVIVNCSPLFYGELDKSVAFFRALQASGGNCPIVLVTNLGPNKFDKDVTEGDYETYYHTEDIVGFFKSLNLLREGGSNSTSALPSLQQWINEHVSILSNSHRAIRREDTSTERPRFELGELATNGKAFTELLRQSNRVNKSIVGLNNIGVIWFINPSVEPGGENPYFFVGENAQRIRGKGAPLLMGAKVMIPCYHRDILAARTIRDASNYRHADASLNSEELDALKDIHYPGAELLTPKQFVEEESGNSLFSGT